VDLAAAVPQTVVTYIDLVLNASPSPDGFPAHWRLAYVPESRQLVIEYDLPEVDVVPTVNAYRYVKASDTISETARPKTQVKACLLTLRTTRRTFGELDLRHVDPAACPRHLGAGVSRNPEELAPVRPVLEFDMVDPRFIEETDVIGGLDERPNLLAMTPSEFESLIQNLVPRMGLDTCQTHASRDGGVDCVAFDPRPIMAARSSSRPSATRTRSASPQSATCTALCRTKALPKASWSRPAATEKRLSTSPPANRSSYSTAPTCSTCSASTQASKPESKPRRIGATPPRTAQRQSTRNPCRPR
jgi:Restriction endonuclease